jgi:hypothetical protein
MATRKRRVKIAKRRKDLAKGQKRRIGRKHEDQQGSVGNIGKRPNISGTSRPKSKSEKSASKKRKSGQHAPQEKRAAKRGRRAPRKRKPSPLSRAKAELKRTKKKLAETRRKLREARVKRRVQALKERSKKRLRIPQMIKVLPGLDEYDRRRAILDILSTADDSDEYWELVAQIADELELTTYMVASFASPPRGGVFHVAA